MLLIQDKKLIIQEVDKDEFSREVAEALDPNKKMNSGPTSTKND